MPVYIFLVLTFIDVHNAINSDACIPCLFSNKNLKHTLNALFLFCVFSGEKQWTIHRIIADLQQVKQVILA
uniref:Uncharacterized protein n=1 Tax=Anguilla anguilla TaxID=7936 RepID=A0A0E9VDQ1_ANGAN